MTRRWSDIFDEGPADLFAILRASVRADVRDAADALRRSDASRISYVAHRLNGSARLADDKQAVALCVSLEAAAQSGDMKHAKLLLDEIERVFDEALHTRGSS
ncbi:Hpt protein [Paraburkholderia piptadeniae]|uniref:Hpt protein n=1 Tax=Paraburkholderia piptadeniae TaxID=1701573 RepID=A0A1N7S740_9BURK|nr:Hpt domain-containing protein [Paraburkholderia piptadeniae]SIT43224.1 Hpt protein [Paraburkholderia piptadeniae]